MPDDPARPRPDRVQDGVGHHARSGLPVTICETCRAKLNACDARRMFSGEPCCRYCGHAAKADR